MSPTDAISAYGYAALFLGTVIEGETFLVIAVMLARQGCLELPAVMATALLGAISGDLFFFGLGRCGGKGLLARWPAWQSRLAGAEACLRRCQLPVIAGFRFLYGFRSVIPFAIGMSPFPAGRFVLLDALGAAAWVGATVAAGLLLDEILLHQQMVPPLWPWVLAAAAAAAVCLFWGRRRRRGSRRACGSSPGPEALELNVLPSPSGRPPVLSHGKFQKPLTPGGP